MITTMINGKTPQYISCGGYHTIVLMTDGTIWGTGRNGSGQLGLNDTTQRLTLTQMDSTTIGGKTPQYISCGEDHTIVLMTDGTIWGTGRNGDGQLGLNDTTNRQILTQMDTTTIGGKTPKYISCGQRFTIVLMTDGTIWGTGYNAQGQLGLNDTTNRQTLTRMDTTMIEGRTPQYISCGSETSYTLMTDGTIWGTGNNGQGQLGLNDFDDRQTLTQMGDNNNNIAFIMGMMNYQNDINANICFPSGTPIQTDQGMIEIEKINPNIHTINKKPIVDITKTITSDKYLIGFKKNALGLNYPSQNTRMTQEHKLLYAGKMCEAKTFLNKFEKVIKVKYNGEILYNVLMEEHSQMRVNNLICETLHPENIVAKLYTKKSKYTNDEKDKIVVLLKECIKKKDYKTYNRIIERC
jgi:hypothetical protein